MATSLQSVAALLFLVGAGAIRAQGDNGDPEAVVRRYLHAVAAMDAEKIHSFLAADYTLVGPDGAERAYDRSRTASTCAWERGMNTRWSFQVLAVHGDTVTVLTTERSDYYTLLGLGGRHELEEETIAAGHLIRTVGRVSIEERSSQDVEYPRFKRWLLAHVSLAEPELVDAEGGLRFDGASARRMLFWLREWARVRAREGPSSQ